jgi:ribosomal protein S18 acetylase RimI-like enzyme
MEPYLARNPGMSFVACDGGRVVGAVLCGTDGRRGYLHHLAVAAPDRQRGLGRALVQRCLDALAAAGITKCHLFVFAPNIPARNFWTRIGWRLREDIVVMSRQMP